MPIQLKYFVGGVFLSGSATTLYTCPQGKTAQIHAMTLVNTDTTGRLAYVYILRSGDSAASDVRLIGSKPISVPEGTAGARIVTSAINQILQQGDVIQAYADVAAKVTMNCSGVEVS